MEWAVFTTRRYRLIRKIALGIAPFLGGVFFILVGVIDTEHENSSLFLLTGALFVATGLAAFT